MTHRALIFQNVEGEGSGIIGDILDGPKMKLLVDSSISNIFILPSIELLPRSNS